MATLTVARKGTPTLAGRCLTPTASALHPLIATNSTAAVRLHSAATFHSAAASAAS